MKAFADSTSAIVFSAIVIVTDAFSAGPLSSLKAQMPSHNARPRLTELSEHSTFLEEIECFSGQEKEVATRTPDTALLGTLTVPSVGIGTISWSSNSRK